MGQKINSNFFRLTKNSSTISKYQGNNFKKLPSFTFKNIGLKNYIYNIFNKYSLVVVNLEIKQSESFIFIIIKYYTTDMFYIKCKNFISTTNFTSFELQDFNKDFLFFKNFFIKKLIAPIKIFVKKKTIKVVLQNLNENSINFFKDRQEKFFFKKLLVQLRKFNRFSFYEEGLNSVLIFLQSSKFLEILTNFVAKQFKILKRHNLFLNFLKRLLTLFLHSSFSVIKGIKILIKGRLNGKPRANHKLIQIGKISLQTLDSNVNFSYKTSYSIFGTFGIKIWSCEKSI